MPALQPPVLLVDNLDAARGFYVHALGCRVVETTPDSLALEFHGHALALRTVPGEHSHEAAFLLGVDDWCTASERLREHAIDVEIETARRFSATPGDQCALRLHDPDGNALALLGFAPEADQLAA